MDDRNRSSPVALARNKPVAQAEVFGLLTLVLLGKFLNDCVPCFFARKAVEFSRVDARTVAVSVFFIGDHWNDGKRELLGKLSVSFVMGGNGHNCAGSVIGQNVIRSPDRQLLAVDRVYCVATDEDTGLLAVGGQAFDVVRLLGLL